MKLLKVLFVIQLALGCIWAIPLVMIEKPGLGALLLFMWTFPLHALFMLLALIFFFRRPDTRRVAATVFFTPVILFFLPTAIRALAGGPIAPDADPTLPLLASLLTLPLAICLFLPHQVAQYVPTFVLRSKPLNVAAIVLLAAMLLPWLYFLARAGSLQTPARADSPGAQWIIVAFFYALATGLVALLALLTSYVSLFQHRDRSAQKLRVAQAAVSLLLLLLAVPTVTLSFILVGINPG